MSISLKPSQMQASTGLLSDVDVVIRNPRFDMYDYNGNIATPVPALGVDLVYKDESGEEQSHDQWFSVGKAEEFKPSEDGKKLIAIGKASAINSGSNGALFLTSLMNSGFPEDRIDDDISVIGGTECHVIRQPAPRRKNAKEREDGQVPTVLVVSAIHKLPWESTSTSAAAQSGGASKSSGGQAQGGSSAEDDATNVILELIATNPDGVRKAAIPQKAFALIKDHPNKQAILKLLFDESFLASSPMWKYENQTLTPAG